jgi:hypothetical protein
MHVCLNCGTPNPPDATECESCGMTLTGGPPPAAPAPTPEPAPGETPAPGSTATTHPDDITARYDEFATKVEGLRTGAVTPAAFVEWLAESRQQMWARRDAYVAAAEATADEDDQTQIREALEAILDFEDAIEEMWAFTLGQTGVSGLDDALAQMWQANQRINEAMRKNRDFRASLTDDWGGFM